MCLLPKERLTFPLNEFPLGLVACGEGLFLLSVDPFGVLVDRSHDCISNFAAPV